MWRSLSLALILSACLAACDGHPEWVSNHSGGQTTTTVPAAAATTGTPAASSPSTSSTLPAPDPDATQVAPDPTPVDSGVIHEYCVHIHWVTHFRPGTTEAQVRTFADTIEQRLCVDGHPRGTNTSGTDTTEDGQEIEWTAHFM